MRVTLIRKGLKGRSFERVGKRIPETPSTAASSSLASWQLFGKCFKKVH